MGSATSSPRAPPRTWVDEDGVFRYSSDRRNIWLLFQLHAMDTLRSMCTLSEFHLTVTSYPFKPPQLTDYFYFVDGKYVVSTDQELLESLVNDLKERTKVRGTRFAYIRVLQRQLSYDPFGGDPIPPKEEDYLGHAVGCLIDMVTMDAVYIDPGNSDLTTEPMDEAKILAGHAKSKRIAGMIQAELVDVGLEVTMHSMTNAIDWTNELFHAHLQPDSELGYCITLHYYFVHACVLYWPLIRVALAQDEESKVNEGLRAFFAHFVCRSFCHVYPPTPEYHARLGLGDGPELAIPRARTVLKRLARDRAPVEDLCKRDNVAWTRFQEFVSSVLDDYLPLVVPELTQSQLMNPTEEQASFVGTRLRRRIQELCADGRGTKVPEKERSPRHKRAKQTT